MFRFDDDIHTAGVYVAQFYRHYPNTSDPFWRPNDRPDLSMYNRSQTYAENIFYYYNFPVFSQRGFAVNKLIELRSRQK